MCRVTQASQTNDSYTVHARTLNSYITFHKRPLMVLQALSNKRKLQLLPPLSRNKRQRQLQNDTSHNTRQENLGAPANVKRNTSETNSKGERKSTTPASLSNKPTVEISATRQHDLVGLLSVDSLCSRVDNWVLTNLREWRNSADGTLDKQRHNQSRRRRQKDVQRQMLGLTEPPT